MDVAEALAGGRYRLLSVLGEGGMATVYRGYDTSLDIERAIKILSPAMAARPSIRKRFEEEARTMARLQHRSIVAVQDVGVDGDRVYMVMELVEGGSLMDLIERRGNPLPPVQACDAVLAILEGLEVAHKRGVVHRDIKPHNVLVTDEGEMKVTDFGIAQVSDRGGATRTGTAMGTWAYMAPEQRSSAKHVDARADVYAVGASLYVLLTMDEPYDLYAAELQEELFSKLPGGLPEVLRKACRYRPEERFASATEMRQALLTVRTDLAAAGGEVAAPVVASAEPGPSHPTIGAWATHASRTGSASMPPVDKGNQTMLVDGNLLDANEAASPSSETVKVPETEKPPATPPAPRFTRPSVPPTGTVIVGDDDLPPPGPRTFPPRGATRIVEDDAPARTPPGPAPSVTVPPPEPRSSAGRWVAIAAALLLAAGGGWAFLAGEQPEPTTTPAPAAKADDVKKTEPTAPAAATTAAATTAAASAPATPPSATSSPAAKTTTPVAPATQKPTSASPQPKPSPAPSATSTAAAKPTPPRTTAASAPPKPEPTPPPAAQAATETGTVFINSQPWSQLTVDGRSVGTTGWKGDLSVGSHAFTMTTSDGATKRFSLSVTRDSPARFCWDFTKDAPCSR